MTKPSLAIAALIVTAMAVLGLYGATLLPAKEEAAETPVASTLTALTEPTVDFADPVRGNRQAPVTVVIFSDYLCDACAQAALTAKATVAADGDRVRLVWKDLPNESYHPGATKMAIAARCAGDQGAFWEFHDLLMERQGEVTATNLVPMAAELNLDIDQFQSCLDNETTRPLVERTVEEATRLRLDATPYFFIGNRRISGALTQEQLQGFIDAADAIQRAASGAEATASAPQP